MTEIRAHATARLLVVDDDEAGRYAKARLLAKAGWEVADAADAASCMQHVAAHPVDLVVLDVQLPDLLGTEVCRWIKQNHPFVLVLQTSATFIGVADRVSGLDAGADAYLTEPCEEPELLATVRSLLRTKAAEDLRRASEAKLADSLAELEVIYHTAPVGLAVLTPDGRFLRINERLAEMNGLPAEAHVGCSVREIVPGIAEECARLLHAVTTTGEPVLNVELSGETAARPGERRTWLEHWYPIRDAAGRVRAVSMVVQEITDRKRREDELRLMMRELTHRSKNLLAVVQSIARHTARESSDFEAFEEKFGSRLQALADSHDLLVRANWRGATVDDLVRSQVSSFAGPERFVIRGPALDLDPPATQQIGLALHELATNAAKYGALANDAGVVEIGWQALPDAAGFVMTWQEQGGPPVARPTRRGFGTLVIERLTAMALGGQAELAFAPDGMSWRLQIPATHLVAADEGTQRP